MKTTKIEWTERTWNPVTGCTKYSEGCEHCYAEVMSHRLKAMKNAKYRHGFEVTVHPESLNEPLKWKKGSTIFVCSMSDLFHKDVPFEFVDKVIDIIKQTPQHNYQILTKRVERMAEYFNTREVPQNAWLGTTIEKSNRSYRINFLKKLKATVRFISFEPLLDNIGMIDLSNIDWVIVGGESGVQGRIIKEEWILNIKYQAEAMHIPFFFKQWGTWGPDGIKRNKKANGKLLQGNIIQEMPFKNEN